MKEIFKNLQIKIMHKTALVLQIWRHRFLDAALLFRRLWFYRYIWTLIFQGIHVEPQWIPASFPKSSHNSFLTFSPFSLFVSYLPWFILFSPYLIELFSSICWWSPSLFSIHNIAAWMIPWDYIHRSIVVFREILGYLGISRDI